MTRLADIHDGRGPCGCWDCQQVARGLLVRVQELEEALRDAKTTIRRAQMRYEGGLLCEQLLGFIVALRNRYGICARFVLKTRSHAAGTRDEETTG